MFANKLSGARGKWRRSPATSQFIERKLGGRRCKALEFSRPTGKTAQACGLDVTEFGAVGHLAARECLKASLCDFENARFMELTEVVAKRSRGVAKRAAKATVR